jgi:hypothetical protein
VTTIEESPTKSGEPVSLLDVLSFQELAELKARVLAAQGEEGECAEDPAAPVGGTVN